MRTRIIECVQAIQAVLKQHNCVISAGQHYSDDCWVEVHDGTDCEIIKFDIITEATFEEHDW